jgi:hypothetical protein
MCKTECFLKVNYFSESLKLNKEQDLSIVGSFVLIEKLLSHVTSTKTYEENKLQTFMSNMVPFGNIVGTNINFCWKV